MVKSQFIYVTVDDFVDFSDEEDINKGSLSKDEDSDFIYDEGEESASDWEMESKKSSHKKVDLMLVSY